MSHQLAVILTVDPNHFLTYHRAWRKEIQIHRKRIRLPIFLMSVPDLGSHATLFVQTPIDKNLASDDARVIIDLLINLVH